MSKKIKALALINILSLLLFPLCVNAKTQELAATSRSAILIDAANGKVYYEKNADERLAMASTTKIMTALTALRYFDADTEITVPACAVGTEGTSATLKEGESYSLEELLYALLLQSANDAAVTIAVGCCGSIEGFAQLMNREARLLRLSDTNFSNPHGLPSEDHFTTARELALITRAALQNELISKIVSSKTAVITSDTGLRRYFKNHNRLLSTYQGADGVKTGYTKASGRCLVSSATRDSVRLIAVTLHSHNDWQEHTNMLDWCFERLSKQN